MEQQFLHDLPFSSGPATVDPDSGLPTPVAPWRSAASVCAGGGGRCDDSAGLSYTLAGDPVTWWCPRHGYELHLGPARPYRLLDLSDDDHRAACHDQWRRLLAYGAGAVIRIRHSPSHAHGNPA